MGLGLGFGLGMGLGLGLGLGLGVRASRIYGALGGCRIAGGSDARGGEPRVDPDRGRLAVEREHQVGIGVGVDVERLDCVGLARVGLAVPIDAQRLQRMRVAPPAVQADAGVVGDQTVAWVVEYVDGTLGARGRPLAHHLVRGSDRGRGRGRWWG